MLRHIDDRALSRALVLLSLGIAAIAGEAEGCALAGQDHPDFYVSGSAKQGQDLVVVHTGARSDAVRYRVGDGDWKKPKIGRDGKFTIPGSELKADQDLEIVDDRSPTNKPLLLPIT